MNHPPTEPCPQCNGTGRCLDDRAVGAAMRQVRIAAGLSLRGVAKRLGVSAPYVSDLELGRRNWSPRRIEDFEKACDPAWVAPKPFTL
jgi:transcriptional regulator with XRE-family HTH domain